MALTLKQGGENAQGQRTQIRDDKNWKKKEIAKKHIEAMIIIIVPSQLRRNTSHFLRNQSFYLKVLNGNNRETTKKK